MGNSGNSLKHNYPQRENRPGCRIRRCPGSITVFFACFVAVLQVLSGEENLSPKTSLSFPFDSLLYSSWQLKNRNRAIRPHGSVFHCYQLRAKLTTIVKAWSISVTAGMAGKSISALKYTLCFFRFLV